MLHVDSNQTDPNSSSMQAKFLRIAREPLVHFLLIGAAVYLLSGLFGQSDGEAELRGQNTIVVTKGEIDWLSETWQKRWNRPPEDDELAALIKEHVKETVLYREAMAMGLDKDDTIIRRRLKQKLEFLAQDLIQPKPPTDEELHAFFEQHIDRYQTPDLITFTHVFMDPDKRGDQTLVDAETLKAKLIDNSTTPDSRSDLGDRFMLQSYYPERSEAELSKLFGSEFARSIMGLEPEQWHGPVLSGYGTHLVYVHDRLEFPPPTYEQVADRVQAKTWQNAERSRSSMTSTSQSLLARYNVVIEGDDSEEDLECRRRCHDEVH